MKTLLIGLLIFTGLMTAQHPPAAISDATSVYEPFDPLIGTWIILNKSGKAIGTAVFKYGPGKSYIWHSVALAMGGTEEPHYEGVLVWNGGHKGLDMLISLDLNGGRVQEQGRLTRGGNGVFTREIMSTGPTGKQQQFRQTYSPEGGEKLATKVMRRTASGWEPTFPGSDQLTYVRKRAH